MIYKLVTQFLHKSSPEVKNNCLFSKKSSDTLLDFLSSKFSQEDIEASHEKIEQAFQDYIRPFGEAIFSFTIRNGISCYIEPYKVDPKKSADYIKIVKLIKSNLDKVEYPYNNKVDQINIPKSLFGAINTIIKNNKEKVNKNSLLTLSIHDALQLTPQAVVTPLKDHCIVKIFNKPTLLNSKINSAPKSVNKSEQRFNGYDEEELKEHSTLIFDEIISLDDFLELVLLDLLNNNLNFHEISNEYYEKNALTIIKKTIAKKLARFIDNNEHYLDGLAGYIFRISFIEVHKKIAFYLLKNLYIKDLKITHFLEYYNKKSISLGSNIYHVPFIVNDQGEMINLTAISSISALWLKPYLQYESVEIEINLLLKSDNQEQTIINLLNKKLTPLETDVSNISKTIKKVTTFINSFDKKILSLKTKEEKEKLKELNKAKYSLYKEEYNKYYPLYKEKLHKLKKMIRKRDLHLHNREQNKLKIKQYKSELSLLEKQYLLHQESFNQIQDSLTNALIQRKKLKKG